MVWDAALVLLHHLDHMHHTQPGADGLEGKADRICKEGTGWSRGSYS